MKKYRYCFYVSCVAIAFLLGMALYQCYDVLDLSLSQNDSLNEASAANLNPIKDESVVVSSAGERLLDVHPYWSKAIHEHNGSWVDMFGCITLNQDENDSIIFSDEWEVVKIEKTKRPYKLEGYVVGSNHKNENTILFIADQANGTNIRANIGDWLNERYQIVGMQWDRSIEGANSHPSVIMYDAMQDTQYTFGENSSLEHSLDYEVILESFDESRRTLRFHRVGELFEIENKNWILKDINEEKQRIYMTEHDLNSGESKNIVLRYKVSAKI